MTNTAVNLRLPVRRYLAFSWLVFVCWFFSPGAAVMGLDRDRTITQFYHTAWTAKDGAPSQISALTQTEDGYLWIGSALGLFRFDGVTFEQYQPPDGVQLPSYNIYALMATPDGGLWISFRPSGLGFLKDGQLKIFSRPEELPTSQVYRFARTPDGRIWAGTGDGLALFNGAGWDTIGADWNFQPKTVKILYTDRGGTLWVSQEDSIVYLPPGSKTFQTFEKPDRFATEFAQAKDGRLWTARYKDLVSPLKDSISGSSAKNPVLMIGAYRILFDRDGSLWTTGYEEVNRIRFPEQLETGTIQKGDSRIESFKEKDGLSGSSALVIFEDQEGNIWVGTMSGLDRFRYSPIVPFILPSSVQRLTLAANERGEIWAGTSTIDRFMHLTDGRFEPVIVQPENIFTSCLYQDADGSNWWGSSRGIWHQQNTKFRYFPPPKDLGGMWEVISGQGDAGLWVSFEGVGLVYFKDGVWERRKAPDGLPNRGPSASFEDEQKRIWLGYTENRVCFLDGGRVQCYTSANGIEIGRIKVIRGRGGNFWFGGETGLAFFKNDRFYTVKTDGKPFGAVSGIIATENGDVWLNEVHGIVNIPDDEIRRLNENPEYHIKYRLYDFQDNLPGAPQMNFTVSTAIEGSDNRLWFATDNGLAMIDPAHLEKNVVPPPVIIKSVFADKKIYDLAEKIEFPAGTANVQINYTATSLSIPERVAFKYRLEGFEDQWHDAGMRREAFFTNLAPGKYHFQVIAANNDGVWNESGATLNFTIQPAFYQTLWFRAASFLFVLLVLAVIFILVYHWRLGQATKTLNAGFEERLMERGRIAQDLHDTLLQGFLGVTMRLQAVSNLLPAKPDKAKGNLEDVLNQVDIVLEEGRRAVWDIRSSTVTENDLAQAFTLVGEELSKTYSADFSLTIDGESRDLHPLVRDEVYRIGREALTNAFRHSKADEIEAAIEYAPKYFRIFVRDDGCGIAPEILSRGREGHLGFSGMLEGAERIGAQINFWSRTDGGGTEMELSIPKHIAFKNSSGGFLKRLNDSFARRRAARKSSEIKPKK